MKRALMPLSALLVALSSASALAVRESDSEVLLRCFVRYTLAREIHAQALGLGKTMAAPDLGQVEATAASWLDAEVQMLRGDLEKRFKDGARGRFEQFVGEFTAAEDAADSGYLERLAMHTGLTEPPPDYATLRRLAMERWMEKPLSSGTKLLSEIQTWADVRAKSPNTPSLEDWLNRSVQPVQVQAPKNTPPPVKKPVNPLAAAEAPVGEWDPGATPAPSALDAFAQRRKDRRDQAMADAQSGMQQMATERQAAEQEYGARKMAEAQADAEAMRAQAQRLAATESEALAQRENSWGNRIKRIIGGTLSAGIGAFTGGVGAEAGQRAANELFK